MEEDHARARRLVHRGLELKLRHVSGRLDFAPEAAVTILRDMRELVRKQLLTVRHSGSIVPLVKDHILPDGISQGIHSPRGLRARASVCTRTRLKVVAEARLHEAPRGAIQRLAG